MFKLNNFKYLLIGVIIGGLLSAPMVQAANAVKLVVNGEDITYKSDVPPQIIDGRTLVPARALAEALGANVEWDEGNRAVVVKGREVSNNLQQTERPSIDSNKPIETTFNDMQAIEKDGEVFVLLSDYEETFYKDGVNYLQWNEEDRIISLIINSKEVSVLPFEIINDRTYINSRHLIDFSQM